MTALKKVVIAIVTLLSLAFIYFVSTDMGSHIDITINGSQVDSNLAKFFGGIIGLTIAAVTLFCIALLLVLVFSGVGVLILGIAAIVFIILAAIAIPFLSPILLPLAVVLIFLLYKKNKNLEN